MFKKLWTCDLSGSCTCKILISSTKKTTSAIAPHTSLSVLYVDGVRLSDLQMTLQGLGIAACMFFVSRASATEELSEQRPRPSIVSAYAILTMLGQVRRRWMCRIVKEECQGQEGGSFVYLLSYFELRFCFLVCCTRGCAGHACFGGSAHREFAKYRLGETPLWQRERERECVCERVRERESAWVREWVSIYIYEWTEENNSILLLIASLIDSHFHWRTHTYLYFFILTHSLIHTLWLTLTHSYSQSTLITRSYLSLLEGDDKLEFSESPFNTVVYLASIYMQVRKQRGNVFVCDSMENHTHFFPFQSVECEL